MSFSSPEKELDFLVAGGQRPRKRGLAFKDEWVAGNAVDYDKMS